MDVSEIFLILMLYTVFVALIALIYFLLRRRRSTDGGLPIPNIAGLKLKSRPDRSAFPWEGAEVRASAVPSTLDHQSLEPVGITPGSYVPINISPVVTIAAETDGSQDAPQPAEDAVPALIVEERDNVEPHTPALSRALSDIFGSSGPLLPQGMRTLEVTPNRIIEPGCQVHAVFTFRNLGGGPASGFRVRFRLPEGLTYDAGSARIGDTPLDEHDALPALLHVSGADIGDVPAGSELRIELSLRVAAQIENGTIIALQAALASVGVPVIGSNIVQLVVRSVPMLQNSQTTLALTAVREALPGEELQLSARVHNSGQSSAHDVVVILALPANTTFSPNSATIDGHYAGGSDNVPFGFARPTVVAPTLPPGATIGVGYRVRVGVPLEDGSPITLHGSVCSQEIAEFFLPPVTVNVPSTASFASPESSFSIDGANRIEPGERMRFVLRVKNVGTASARKTSVVIALPLEMLFTAGSLTIDGAPTSDDGIVPDAVVLGDLEPGRSVELALSAIVRSPMTDGRELRATAMVAWAKGQRIFEQTIVVRSAPRFPAVFNRLESAFSRHVAPGELVSYTIAIQNMGTDAATDVRLRLAADHGLERVRARDRATEIALDDDGTVTLGSLKPGDSRWLDVEAQVAAVIGDQTQLGLRATLWAAHVDPIELGTQMHIVDSRPAFSLMHSHISIENDAELRFNDTCDLRLTLTNEGSDRGRDVRVVLALPDGLNLERVGGDAVRDGHAIAFGDIAANRTREARLTLRLVGMVSSSEPVEISARVGGRNVVPFGLRPIHLSTRSGPAFTEGAALTSMPTEMADAGTELEYTLSLRNSGTGIAKLLTARIAELTNAVYAQGSTIINGIALADRAGTSVLLGQTGLQLADVGPGVDVIAHWRVIVNMPLPPTATVETVATVRWDDAPELAVVATPVGVRSTSALPITNPALPFSVLGATAARDDATPSAGLLQLESQQVRRLKLGPGVFRTSERVANVDSGRDDREGGRMNEISPLSADRA